MAGEGIAGLAKAATPWGAIATGLSTVLNLGLGIADRIKANKLQKQWNKLYSQRPEYEIPEAYTQALSLYKQRAAETKMPGQNILEENIQQSSARARTAAERGAISSASYGAQASDIYTKELEAIQDLGVQAARFQWQNQAQLGEALQRYGGEQEKAQDWNKLGKWTTGMNVLESQMGAKTQNANAYLGNAAAGLANFAGTQYYQQMLNQMQGGGSSLQGWSTNQSAPVGAPISSQNKLMGTANGIMQNISTYYTDPLLSYKYNK